MQVLDYFQYPAFQYALIACILAGAALSLVGNVVIHFKLTTVRFALMHIAILGGAVGLLIGVKPLLGAMVAIIVGSVLFGPLAKKIRIEPALLSGLLTTGTLAIALMLFYVAKVPAMEVYSLFTGSILTLMPLDLVWMGLLGIVIVGVFYFFYREIQLIFYDEAQAEWMGVPVQAIKNTLLFLVGITIGVSIKIVGALLIDAIVLLPALAAMRIGNSLRSTLIYSSIFGVITTVGGFLVALLFDLPTGASISAMGVIALCFTYVVRR